MYEEEWENWLTQQNTNHMICPWCGQNHNDLYSIGNYRPTYHQGLTYCSNCFTSLQEQGLL